MALVLTYRGKARGLLLAAGALVLAAAVTGPARAGDDGQQPIWSGLGGIVGFTDTGKVDEPIDYGERGRLVLPPKMDQLPPPATGVQRTADWPQDPDVVRVQKKREAALHYETRNPATDKAHGYGRPISPDLLRSDHAEPGIDSAHNSNCAKGNKRNCNWVPPDILEKLGLKKSDDAVIAGEEPDRDWLTDPPKGYRKAFANTKAGFEPTSHIDTGDQRAALFKPPSQ